LFVEICILIAIIAMLGYCTVIVALNSFHVVGILKSSLISSRIATLSDLLLGNDRWSLSYFGSILYRLLDHDLLTLV